VTAAAADVTIYKTVGAQSAATLLPDGLASALSYVCGVTKTIQGTENQPEATELTYSEMGYLTLLDGTPDHENSAPHAETVALISRRNYHSHLDEEVLIQTALLKLLLQLKQLWAAFGRPGAALLTDAEEGIVDTHLRHVVKRRAEAEEAWY